MSLPSQNTPGPDHQYEVLGENEVEPKTKAGAAGAGAGAVVSAFLVWAADELWWNGGAEPQVPFEVAALIGLVVTPAIAFASAYYTRHVNR